jgi:predicted CoA-binding protein
MNVARIPALNITEPGATEDPARQDLVRIYKLAKTIAVVGSSAVEEGLTVVAERCMGVTHRKLGLGSGRRK